MMHSHIAGFLLLWLICVYEGQSKITEPYLITLESSKMDIYLDNISNSYMTAI